MPENASESSETLTRLLLAVERLETIQQERRDAVHDLKSGFDQYRLDMDRKFEELKNNHSSMRTDVREVRDAMLYTKGGWKVLLAFGALCISIGGLIVKVPWENITKAWGK
jgi:hypothetical protein